MTRREWMWSAAAAPLQRRIDYPEYARCLPDYLRMLAANALAARNKAIGKTTSPAAVRARQRWARETFWKLIGKRPVTAPLDVRVTGSFERAAYSVRKLVYQTQPGVLVAANLYLPKSGNKLYPGVLFQMGHTPNGKCADQYQRCCQGLVQLGYVVLAFDPMGQGERTNYPGPNGLTRLNPDAEHSVPGKQMLLIGETATAMQVWDAMRSLDVLAMQPMVDAKRLGSTGQSGGGTLTMLLAAVDDRLAAAAVSSGNTENLACANFRPPGSTDDAEQDLIASGPAGFDRWDLLWPLAPRPLLIVNSAKDYFGTYSPNYVENGRAEFQRLQSAYAALGAKDEVQYTESPLPHGLTYGQRVAIYDFFERKLKGGSGAVTIEPETAVEPDETLWACPKGNVRNLGSRTPFELAREKGSEIRTPSAVPDLRRLLGMAAAVEPRVRTLSVVPSMGCDVAALDVPSAPHVSVPVWAFRPRQKPKGALLLLDPGGRNRDWREGGMCHQLAAAGITVYAADVRGIGDLRPEYSSGAPSYTGPHQQEEDYAWASLMLGSSLLGQRVTDILSLVAALGPVHVAARGELTVPALCAAALEPRIASLYLAGHLLSWRSITQVESYSVPLANFAFDALHHTDLPKLAAQIQPRRVVLAGVVDAANRRMDIASVRLDYAESNIRIFDKALWDVEEFLKTVS